MTVGTDTDGTRAAARIAAARGAQARADARLTDAIADLALPDDTRLDERTRSTLVATLTAMLDGLATDLRRHAARILAGQGESARAEALLTAGDAAATTAHAGARAGLMRDRRLIGELVARVRMDLIADALPTAVGSPDQASLLIRLSEVDDGVVAAAARSLLAAEARRRTAGEAGRAATNDLPADLHHLILWWTAAAIRNGDVDTDRAIVAAAQRSLAAHDEGDRVEAAAMRLAQAIDARPDELGPLLAESLGDRRLALFVAVLARAASLDYDSMRASLLEPEGDRLWLALRAVSLDRPAIARIALSLSEADPRRDIEAFADDLDVIASIPVDAARAALAPMTLHPDFRAAIDALARGGAA